MLFTDTELAAYLQQPSVNTDTAALLHDLAVGLIEDVYGDVLPDPAPSRFKRIALEVVKRAYVNPNGYVSERLGDYSYNLGAAGVREVENVGVYLTDRERQAIVAASGRSTVRTVQFVQPYHDSTATTDVDLWT